MSDYLDSSLYLLEMYFYDQSRKGSNAHISRKKRWVSNPFAFPALRNDSKINLRDLIEATVLRTESKKLEITDEQYEKLDRVDIYYQSLEAGGYGYLTHCHWSVFEGLSVCQVSLDRSYVQDWAIYYSADSINAEAWDTSHCMIREDLSAYSTENARGKRFVMTAADYPPEETQRRCNAYWEKARQAWQQEYAPHFSSWDNPDLKKKSVVIATEHHQSGSVCSKIYKILDSLGAAHKYRVGKNTHYLLVDMEQIEKLDCYAERLWRLRSGDEQNAAKVAKLSLAQTVAFNEAGSKIRIISLQEFLTAQGVEYSELCG